MGSQGIHLQQTEAIEPSEESSQPIETNPAEDQGPPPVEREACDLQIMLGLPEQQKVCLISQLVDISEDEEEVN